MSSVTFRCKKSKFVISDILTRTELKENMQLICTGDRAKNKISELNNRYEIKTIAKLKRLCILCKSIFYVYFTPVCILYNCVFCAELVFCGCLYSVQISCAEFWLWPTRPTFSPLPSPLRPTPTITRSQNATNNSKAAVLQKLCPLPFSI